MTIERVFNWFYWRNTYDVCLNTSRYMDKSQSFPCCFMVRHMYVIEHGNRWQSNVSLTYAIYYCVSLRYVVKGTVEDTFRILPKKNIMKKMYKNLQRLEVDCSVVLLLGVTRSNNVTLTMQWLKCVSLVQNAITC